MAKMFYTLDETKAALGAEEEEIKQMTRQGRLREFRDGPRLMFKTDQVDAVKSGAPGHLNEQVDDDYAGSSMMNLKDDSALAADLGLNNADAGLSETNENNRAGLLDLTRENDETSSGAELLDEISPSSSSVSRQSRTPRPPLEIRYSLEGQHDRDATAGEAALDVYAYANVLAGLVDRSQGNFCFGLLGHWGRGKTYLMQRVREVLERKHKKGEEPAALKIRHRYRVVKFSAWAYPNAPLLWVHLYETLSREATYCPLLIRLTRALRTGALRHGMILMAIGMFLLAAVVADWESLEHIGKLILSGGIAAAGATFILTWSGVGSKAVAGASSKFLSVANHDEKLGLQAAIGKDLRALLVGWMPGPYRNWPINLKRQFSSSRFFVYAVACMSVSSAVRHVEPVGVLQFIFFRVVAPGIYTLPIMVFLALISLWALVCSGWGAGNADRVLLYVDDLDRCEPEKMLEVMEGLMQFLESSEIGDRLQVIMLVDEVVLVCAIIKKYGHIAQVGKGPSVPDLRQITIENIEKLFIGYLVLPQLSATELSDVARHYFEQLQKNDQIALQAPGETDPDEAKRQLVDDNAVDVNQVQPPPPSRPVGVISKPMVYRWGEAKLLSKAVERLSEARTNRLGPRSVRGLLFRYQLARNLILEKTHRESESWTTRDASELIHGIIDADANKDISNLAAGVAGIVRQVSLTI